MFKIEKKIKIFLVVLFSFSITFPLYAQTAEDLFKQGLNETSEQIGYDRATRFNQSLPQTVGEFIQIFLSILGVLFLLLTIYGGFIWMMARGNEQEVEKAKRIIEHSTIGLLIIFGAYAITYYIFDVIM